MNPSRSKDFPDGFCIAKHVRPMADLPANVRSLLRRDWAKRSASPTPAKKRGARAK